MSHVLEAPAQQKKGSIHKCPSCGASLGAFVSSCPACGHEFLDVDANRSITALAERFEEIERDIDALGYKGKRREQAIIEKKARVIRDFPVPNSRDDLQQLIYYIQPKIVASVKPDPNVEDWRAKFIEVITRAKNAYKNDAVALAEFAQIEASLNNTLAKDIQIKAKRNPLFFALLAGVLIIGAGAFINHQMEQSKLKACEQSYAQGAAAEKSRLEKLYAEIEQAVHGKDFAAAQAKAGQLRWEFEASCKMDENAQAKVDWQEKAGQIGGLIRSESEHADAAAQAEANRLVAEKQAAADRVSAERVAEQDKQAELARIEADKQKAAAAKVATEKRKAATEQQW
jgi:hypothetical protein